MCNQIRKAQRKRNRVYKKAKKSGNEQDWNIFKTARNTCTTEIKKAKVVYEEKLADELREADQNDSRKWWKTVNHFLGNTQKDTTNSPLMNGTECVTDSKKKAEAFNKYFVEQANLDVTEEDIRHLQNPQIPEHKLETITILEKDVLDILCSLKPNKASGPDNISPRVLKNTAKTLAPVLEKFFNICLHKKQFPDAWKIANVTPIFKKGDTDNVKNYRPISLLSCIGKVFERCVCKYVMNFFRQNNIITKMQAGYVGEGSSTITQLLEIYHDIMMGLEHGKDLNFVFLDASKAFDRVWHEGLIFKLKQCGICGDLLNWFEDYLDNRWQKVVIHGECSDLQPR